MYYIVNINGMGGPLYLRKLALDRATGHYSAQITTDRSLAAYFTNDSLNRVKDFAAIAGWSITITPAHPAGQPVSYSSSVI